MVFGKREKLENLNFINKILFFCYAWQSKVQKFHKPVSDVESYSVVVEHSDRCLNSSTTERRSSWIIYLLLTLPKEELDRLFADYNYKKICKKDNCGTQLVLKRRQSRSTTFRRARLEQGWSGGCPEPPLLSKGIPGAPLIVGSAKFISLLSKKYLNIVLLSGFKLNEIKSSDFGSAGQK